MSFNEELLAVFREEADENLTELERGLLSLEEAPDDPAVLNEVFRHAHSFKGGAAMVGFTVFFRLAHTLEHVLERMRDSEVTVTSNVCVTPRSR